MNKLSFSLYGYDKSPASMLQMLADEAISQNYEVHVVPGQTEGSIEHVCRAARSDVLAIGLSALNQQEIVFAQQVLQQNSEVKIVVVEDTIGGRFRGAQYNFSAQIHAVLAAVPNITSDDAARYEYQHVVEEAGPPPHWKPIFENMIIGMQKREYGDRKFVLGDENLEFTTDDVVIYVPGTKEDQAERMNQIIIAIRNAGRAIMPKLGKNPDNCHIMFRAHPGKVARSADEEASHAQALKQRSSIQNVHILNPRKGNNDELDGQADITIYAGGGPTSSIAAAQLDRKNTGYVYDPKLRDILGFDVWPMAQNASSVFVPEVNEAHLQTVLMQLIQADKGKTNIDTAQFDTAPKYVDLLEKIARG